MHFIHVCSARVLKLVILGALLFQAGMAYSQARLEAWSILGPDGRNPCGLTLASDGNFYGASRLGGLSYEQGVPSGTGTIFRITPTGNLTRIHVFDGTDGSLPITGIVQGKDLSLYGVASSGGKDGWRGPGIIYKVSLSGVYKVLHEFNITDGEYPNPLLIGKDGNFYGTTTYGGAHSYGVIFRMDSSGAVTLLHSFNIVDGSRPNGRLAQTPDGTLYGVTGVGGATGKNFGTVFQINPDGTSFRSLYSFSGPDGIWPSEGLVLAGDGNLYGATAGGANLQPFSRHGTLFRITPLGELQTIHTFDGMDGSGPGSFVGENLELGPDGSIYGATAEGGMGLATTMGWGTIFRIDTHGSFSCLYRFPASNDSYSEKSIRLYYPIGNIAFAPNGDLYGTSGRGGQTDDGAIYRLRLGTALVPSVSSLSPAMGPPGTMVSVVGNHFTGSVNVTLNGVSCENAVVVNDKLLIFKVPAGGTSGKVTVITPKGNSTSATTFSVSNSWPVPMITSFFPTSGPPGTLVAIRGTGRSSAMGVTVGGKNTLSGSARSDSLVTYMVGPGTGVGKISISTKGGTATSTAGFTVTAASSPTISSVSHSATTINVKVTVVGQNFMGVSSLKFNGVPAYLFRVLSPTTITAYVPSTATSGKVTVSTVGGTATSARNLGIAPVLSSFSPILGVAGTAVTITGTNFNGATKVMIGDVLITNFTVVSNTTIHAVVPPGAASGIISVSTPIGTGNTGALNTAIFAH